MMISQQWSSRRPLYNHMWPIVLLCNRPAVRPRPARLNTPDHVACELKSTTRTTSRILGYKTTKQGYSGGWVVVVSRRWSLVVEAVAGALL